MAEGSLKNIDEIKYGVVGRLHYNPASEIWTSKRRLSLPHLSPLSSPKSSSRCNRLNVFTTTFHTVIESSDPDLGCDPPLSKERSRQTEEILTSHAVLASATEYLRDYSTLEEAGWLPQDPQFEFSKRGETLSLGLTYNIRIQSNPFEIAAYLSSILGKEYVAVRELRQGLQAWREDDSIRVIDTTYVELNDFATAAQTTYLRGDGGRIKQICFGPTTEEDKISTLAVRSTVGLKLYTFSVTTGDKISSEDIIGPPTRIFPKLIASLNPLGSTGDEFMDVCFSPWTQADLAAVTIQGKWYTWYCTSLKTRYINSKLRATGEIPSYLRMAQGSSRGNGNKFIQQSMEWYKVFFVANPRTIVICSRKQIAAVDTEISSTLTDPVNLDISGTIFSILDVKASPVAFDDIFLVTNMHLFWIRLTSSSSEATSATMSFSILSKWQHSRDLFDTSLRLSILDVSSTVNVCLFSCETNIVTEYWFQESNEEDMPQTMTQPHRIDLPLECFIDDRPRQHAGQIQNLVFKPVDYSSNIEDDRFSSSQLALCYKQGTLFYQLLVHFKDQSIMSGLCYINPRSNVASEQVAIIAPKWNDYFRRLPNKVSENMNFIANDDSDDSGIDEEMYFGDEEVYRQKDELKTFRHKLPWHQKFSRPILDDYGLDYASDLQSYSNRALYDRITIPITMEGKELAIWTTELPLKLQDKFEEQDEMSLQTIALLYDDLETLNIGDLERSADSLSHILETSNDSNAKSNWPSQVKLECLAAPNLSALPRVSSPMSMLEQYRRFVACYIDPLPPEISNRARLARERLTRKFAASLCLASFIVKMSVPQGMDSPVNSQMDLQSQQLSQEAPSSVASQPQWLAQSQRSIASFQPVSSGTSSFQPAGALTQPVTAALKRLKAYSTISMHASADPERNEAVERVLAHWTIGTDPASYDYVETDAQVRGMRVIQGTAMSAEQQRRVLEQADRQRLRTELREQRVNKRARLQQHQQGHPSGNVAPVVSASQPTLSSFAIPARSRQSDVSASHASFQARKHQTQESQYTENFGDASKGQKKGQGERTSMSARDVTSLSQQTSQRQGQTQAPSISLASSQIAQSQAVPGRYGERQKAGDSGGGKKRKAGF